MNSPPEPTPEEPEQDAAWEKSIEQLHADFASQLERIAWAILRDWPLAADAVQEAFALLAKKQNELPTGNQRGWLVRTVQFQAQNLRRKQDRARNLAERLGASGLVREEATGYLVERREELEQLKRAIGELPKPQRVVVQMRLGEEKSFSEIAGELELPLGTVLSRMRLALAKLRTKLRP